MHRKILIAGWSSPVARQAHNLKVAGSNPAPATKEIKALRDFSEPFVLPRAAYFDDKNTEMKNKSVSQILWAIVKVGGRVKNYKKNHR